LVEHDLAKVGVAGSSLVSRSKIPQSEGFLVEIDEFRFINQGIQIENPKFLNSKFYRALVVELVDTQDLKSCGHCGRIGSIPIRGTKSRVSEQSESDGNELCFFVRSHSVSLSLPYFLKARAKF